MEEDAIYDAWVSIAAQLQAAAKEADQKGYVRGREAEAMVWLKDGGVQQQIDDAVCGAEAKENELWTTVLNNLQKSLEKRENFSPAGIATIDSIRKLYRYEREQLSQKEGE